MQEFVTNDLHDRTDTSPNLVDLTFYRTDVRLRLQEEILLDGRLGIVVGFTVPGLPVSKWPEERVHYSVAWLMPAPRSSHATK